MNLGQLLEQGLASGDEFQKNLVGVLSLSQSLDPFHRPPTEQTEGLKNLVVITNELLSARIAGVGVHQGVCIQEGGFVI